jgi:hypothetical protein
MVTMQTIATQKMTRPRQVTLLDNKAPPVQTTETDLLMGITHIFRVLPAALQVSRALWAKVTAPTE